MSVTLEELIGSTLVVGIPGTRLTDEVANHLRAIHAGGFIPFARNFESPEQFRALVKSLNEACGRELLVMVDHEGGRVVRFSSGVTQFPDALTVGASQTPDEVRRQGQIEAEELRALGAHVNLAPCVDVLVSGSDPVIGDRSYGHEAKRVAEFSVARIHGLQDHGVAACAKHFPGLGAVPKDPHKQLPVVTLDWEDMRTVHLKPFIESIQAGVATIMSSHVCYPKLDSSPSLPATFSKRLIHELLRRELGFQGLILSDDLEMGALRGLCPIGEAAVRAVEAGHDMLLICSDVLRQRQAFDALCEEHRTGRLSVAALEQRVEQIRKSRKRFSCT
ncbi:MAG: beta-N-acetylhexosaminidase [Candidatus Omnitrophica bacterium]|nr:beta-N-acetylhexosaminidase [Candidatus Omnitrophota bacterium]